MAAGHQTSRGTTRRWSPRTVVMMLGIAILPLLYGGLLTSAYQDPVGNLDHIRAAVVNEDVATVVTNASGEKETIDLGQSLTQALTEPTDGEDMGFSWTAMDSTEAAKALANQDVRAVLTIPAELSASSSVLSEGEAPNGAAPQLQLITDDGISYLAGNLATQVASTLQKQLSTQGAENYVNGLLASMTTLQTGLDEGADGASTLADGIDTVQSGADRLASGASGLLHGEVTF